MKQCNANRKRNKLVNFWVTPDEIALIETRVKLTGLAKGEYLIETLLKQDISILAGKYESDRLSLQLSRLSDALNHCDMNTVEGKMLLDECKLLFQELIKILKKEVDVSGKDIE